MNKIVSFENKTFTIIGAGSYIAKHIICRLKQYGSTVYLYDKEHDSKNNFAFLNFVDITCSDDVKKIKVDVDYILFFSGLTGTVQSFDNYKSYIEVNEIGLLNVLTLLRDAKSKARVVYPSTRLLYKGKNNYALKEEDEKEIRTIYALNKYNAELYLKFFSEYFELPYTIFRICVPYGNALDDNFSFGTLGHFMGPASKGQNITVFGNGEQKRSFTHIQDIVDIILDAISMEESKNEIYNVGGPDTLSVMYVANAIASLFGVDIVVKEWPLFMKKIESGDTIFDSSKIETLTAYKYKYSFDKWLLEQRK